MAMVLLTIPMVTAEETTETIQYEGVMGDINTMSSNPMEVEYDPETNTMTGTIHVNGHEWEIYNSKCSRGRHTLYVEKHNGAKTTYRFYPYYGCNFGDNEVEGFWMSGSWFSGGFGWIELNKVQQ